MNIFPFWNGPVISFHKIFVSSGILLMYLCSWYKSWQACNRHSIENSRFWSVCCVCRNVYFVSCDSLCSFWEKLVFLTFVSVVGVWPSVKGVVVLGVSGIGRFHFSSCYGLQGPLGSLEGGPASLVLKSFEGQNAIIIKFNYKI